MRFAVKWIRQSNFSFSDASSFFVRSLPRVFLCGIVGVCEEMARFLGRNKLAVVPPQADGAVLVPYQIEQTVRGSETIGKTRVTGLKNLT